MSGKKSVSPVVSPVDSLLEKFGLQTVKKSEGSFTIGEIADLMTANQWVTDSAFQRSERSAWLNPEFSDAVLDSIFRGVGFGGITINSIDSGYSVIDGGHRSRLIARVLGGSVSWHGVNLCDNPALIAAFRSVVIPITEYEGLDDSDCGLIFEAINGGVALSTVEKRRNRISWLMMSAAFKAAVKNLLEVLPSVAGRSPRRETAEEIILQALAGAGGARDYSGNAVIAWHVANQTASLSLLSRVADNVAAVRDYVKADTESTLKRGLKKSWLNVWLGLDGVDLNHFAGFLAQFSDVESVPADQVAFKGAASSGSASSSAVSVRWEIAERANKGQYTRGVVKIKGEKSPKAGKDSGNVETPEVQAESGDKPNKWAAMIAKEFGKGTYSAKEEARIIDHLTLLGDDDAVLVELKNKSGIVSHWIQSKAGRVSVADVIQRG